VTETEQELWRRIEQLEKHVQDLERRLLPPLKAVWFGHQIIELKPDWPQWEGTCLACRDGTCTRTEPHT
jgi:hypothetical protein